MLQEKKNIMEHLKVDSLFMRCGYVVASTSGVIMSAYNLILTTNTTALGNNLRFGNVVVTQLLEFTCWK